MIRWLLLGASGTIMAETVAPDKFHAVRRFAPLPTGAWVASAMSHAIGYRAEHSLDRLCTCCYRALPHDEHRRTCPACRAAAAKYRRTHGRKS